MGRRAIRHARTLCLCDRMRAICTLSSLSFSLSLSRAKSQGNGPRILLPLPPDLSRVPIIVPEKIHVHAVSTTFRPRYLATHTRVSSRARARVCVRVRAPRGVAKLSTLSTRNRSPFVRQPVDELVAKERERLSIPRLLDTCQDIRFVNRGAK